MGNLEDILLGAIITLALSIIFGSITYAIFGNSIFVLIGTIIGAVCGLYIFEKYL